MTFLSPWTVAVAAGLTIPALVALYFLKLKRDVRPVASTLLWKKAIEDLHVNAPFQRLKSSLLLLLQLLVLIVGAVALGKPMFETAAVHKDALILLIDESASMGVVEGDGRTRLQRAKEEAKRCIDNLESDAQAMVISFSDRATVVSSFDSDRHALRRKIDSIEQSQSTTSLSEAINLAEAYSQNTIIGGEQAGTDIPSDLSAPPARVFLFTDGRIEDAAKVALERFDPRRISVVKVGERRDNLGIVAMDARRNQDQPEFLEVAAGVANFSDRSADVDAVLYVNGRNVDVQTVHLEAPAAVEGEESGVERTAAETAPAASPPTAVVAFHDIAFEGSGVVEVSLRVADGLPADDRAWSIIEEPRQTRVLLVEGVPGILADFLTAFPIRLTRLTGKEYEAAADDQLLEQRRSAFDLVVFDRHSTSRLPPGNYFFWGAVPLIEGISAGRTIDDQVIFNWDETHPVLRYVGVETLDVRQWLELAVPRDAVSIIEGESSPVLTYLVRGAGRYLICAFSLLIEDKAGRPMDNTLWTVTADFIIFLQNVLNFLAVDVAAEAKKSVTPGQAATWTVPEEAREIVVARPDGSEDRVPVSGQGTVHYARTRTVGVFTARSSPGTPGAHAFAVNLFNPNESWIEPANVLTLGAEKLAVRSGNVAINRPGWPYLLIALLFVILLEWVIYNQRVWV